MKQKLLYAALFVLISGFSFGQTQTVTINWGLFSVPYPEDENFDNENQDTSITIEEGDTVIWDWFDAGLHNVKSTSGPESFGTPDINGVENSTYMNITYEFTFTMLGTYNFICTPHSPIMYGWITVVPEGTLSDSSVTLNEFKLYPNPGTSTLNINLPQVSNSKAEVFDVLGKRIYFQDLTQINTRINIAQWQSGVYLVKVTSDNTSETKRFVKQ